MLSCNRNNQKLPKCDGHAHNVTKIQWRKRVKYKKRILHTKSGKVSAIDMRHAIKKRKMFCTTETVPNEIYETYLQIYTDHQALKIVPKKCRLR